MFLAIATFFRLLPSRRPRHAEARQPQMGLHAASLLPFEAWPDASRR